MTSKRKSNGSKRLDTEDNNEQEIVEDDYLLAQPQALQQGTLMLHQLEAVNWMIGLYNQDASGILADQMGLGKTIEVIAMFAYLYQFRDIPGPHLVICPLAVVKNWQREMHKWLPDLRCEILLATEDEREECVRNIIRPKKFDILVTSYEGAIKSLKELNKFHWDYLVIDEAHRIKNEKSQLATNVAKLTKNRTLLLTGTPLQNDLHELWALLNFLMPQLFNDPELFEKVFATSGNDKN